MSKTVVPKERPSSEPRQVDNVELATWLTSRIEQAKSVVERQVWLAANEPASFAPEQFQAHHDAYSFLVATKRLLAGVFAGVDTLPPGTDVDEEFLKIMQTVHPLLCPDDKK